MPKFQRIGNLQLEQDLAFQRMEWRVERWGKLLIALFLVAAAFGLLGSGLASRAAAGSPSGTLRVHYDRFVRQDAPTSLLVEARGKPDSEIRIWFASAHIDRLKIEQIIPEQVGTESGPDRTTFVFRTGGKGEARVRFDVEPRTAGKATGQIGVDGGESVSFWSFVYP